ncbi:transposase [Nostocaceae cyanobacterium CENA369]|uniref:Transposase n=1 Tax=Dendronalium phyllosphericum CENA369 TaxID=1725256 RepID=A0A8J7IBA3_9NOST|nr:transposase [Dendronalium phyllosphericum]MBH8576968.1 transposase [Dendronalium phyllosphericum CENA369]
MTTELKILGIDVSKSSVTVHLLTSYPKGGLKNYWEKTRNKASSLYPVFYSNPNPKQKQKNAFEFADFVRETIPDIAILEPTGNHYSRLWASILNSLGVKILWVGHIELRRYRGGKNLPNKSDAADALAMAAYPLDDDHQTEDGELNLKYFLMHRPEGIDRLRELCQQLEHLNRVQSPIINYCRQLLAWQFPEAAHTISKSTKVGNVPPLWGWLAQRFDEISPRSLTILNNKYKNSVAVAYGIEIDPTLRTHADWLCDIELEEQRIEAEITALVSEQYFKPYNQIFGQFGFGLRVRARLLSRIYPFEAFLNADSKQLIEYEVREVKRTEKERRDGQTVVKRSVGDTKRIKRNRSRDTFKMRLGMGTVLEQSGDALIEKTSGSALCRMSLWQYVLCQVETGRLPSNQITKALLDYRDSLKSNTNDQGEQLLNGKHLQGKLMAKVCNLLFYQLMQMLDSSNELINND